MLATGIGFMLVMKGLASGLWTVGQGGVVMWLSALVGLMGSLPIARHWAEAIFSSHCGDDAEQLAAADALDAR